MFIARLSVDLLGPVPIGPPLTVRQNIVREGRKLQLLELKLSAEGKSLVRGSVLRVRRPAAEDAPEGRFDDIRHPPPSERLYQEMPGGFAGIFSIAPIEGGFGKFGPAKVWFRMNGGLVQGLEATPVERALAAADFGSGIAAILPFDRWVFPNVDLSLSFLREPKGEWILVDAVTEIGLQGTAICRSRLYDEGGAFGYAAQTLLIERRNVGTKS